MTQGSKIFVRVTARDIEYEGLVALLSASRHGRGSPAKITRTPLNGHYYIELDHKGFADTFCALMKEAVVGHSIVEGLPDGKTFAATESAPKSGGSVFFTPRVAQAVEDWLVDIFTPRKGPFDR